MDPFIGQIQPFGFNFAPVGWLQCNGQIMSIAQNTALFSLIGTTYGGNGVSTFAIPDLRGRALVHPGTGPGLSNISWGQIGGTENSTLTLNNLPSHSHNVTVGVNTGLGEDASPTTKIASGTNKFSEDVTANAFLGGVTEQSVGGNQPFAIRNPYLALNVCIAQFGIFPSRN